MLAVVVALALAQAPDVAFGGVDGGEVEPLEAATDAGLAPEADAGVARETVVVGTPELRTAGSTHTIGGARLKRYELDDPMAVLQSVPGVQVRGEDGFGLRPNIGLRGANPDRSKKVTLLEDGVLFGPAPYSAPAAYYFPLITRMEAVRVVKGPSAIVYGPQTIGGAVDFITRDAAPGIAAGLDLAAGSYAYGKGHGWFSVGNDDTQFVLEGVHLRSDGFKVLDLVGGNTGFQRNEWMAKAKHRVTLGGLSNQFTLRLGISTEESNETYLGLSDADFRAAPLRRYVTSRFDHMSWQRTEVALTHRLFGDGFTLTTTAYRNDFHRTWRKVNHLGGAQISDVLAAPNTPVNQLYLGVLRGEVDSAGGLDTLYIGPNRRDFVSQGVESVFRTAFTTGPLHHALEARARWHYDSIHRLHTEDGFLVRGADLVSDGQPTTVLVSGLDSTHAIALSASDAIAWGRFTFTPGVRAELIFSRSVNDLKGTDTSANTNVVLPGLGVHWQLIDQLGLFAGIYRGFSPPNPGVKDALPELSMNVEAGARWARAGERLEAIGFFNDYGNLTDLCTFSSGCDGENLDRQFSAGRANIYGLEVYGEKRLKLGAATFPLSAAYTFTGSRLLSSFKSDDPVLGNAKEGDELPYVPHHTFNASAGVDVWRVQAHAQFTFIDAMRERAGQNPDPGWTTDVQATLDLHAGFTLTSWATVTFDVRNVTDQHAIVGRRPFGARPNAPRTFIGGLKLTY
ncbi:MAG: TonB-dependent receptor [Myxococcaceae bacterium]